MGLRSREAAPRGLQRRGQALPKRFARRLAIILGPMDSLRLHKDQVVELSVNNLALGGARIPKIDEFVVFVTGGVPGDVVKARVTEFKKRYAGARAVEMAPPPDCISRRRPSFGTRGGCIWQGLDYAAKSR